ncbi:MAG: peptidoglycan DD-metalloendopeptidase family protein [Coriobacteriia bacterium]|nr:peptidoglycan DD-metalloendopeptidase family protein [Coriobacteriia bacterium]
MVRRVLIGGVLLGVLMGAPGKAVAGGWPWPVQGRVGLAYAEPWADASGRICSHGGLDVEASAGARVSASAGGRVAFAGRVPAAGGGSALAVSVVTPDGLRVTYLPLAACRVTAGSEVADGEVLGELAGSGDGSLAIPHLHLSVRRGEAPIDPATLLGPLSRSDAPGPATEIRPPDAPPKLVAPSVKAHAAPAVSPAPASAAVAPMAVGHRAGAAPSVLVAPRPSDWAWPQIEARIRPLPYEPRLDVRAVLTQARALAAAGRGIAIRALLGLLAALLFARSLRSAGQAAVRTSTFAPEPAHARRVRW